MKTLGSVAAGLFASVSSGGFPLSSPLKVPVYYWMFSCCFPSSVQPNSHQNLSRTLFCIYINMASPTQLKEGGGRSHCRQCCDTSRTRWERLAARLKRSEIAATKVAPSSRCCASAPGMMWPPTAPEQVSTPPRFAGCWLSKLSEASRHKSLSA